MTLKADALPGDVDLDIWKRMTTSVQRTTSKKKDAQKKSEQNTAASQPSVSFWDMINPFA
jgi:hypothetical protein